MQWQILLLTLPVVLCLDGSTADMDNVSPVVSAVSGDTDTIFSEDSQVPDTDRDSRAVPGVVVLPVNELSSLPHQVVPGPAHQVVPGPAHHPKDPVNFTYPKPAPVYSKAKCHIEEVRLVAPVCTPTVQKQCTTVRQKVKKLVDMEDCLKIVKTVCDQEEEEIPNELCYYEYNMEEMDGEAKTAEINYDIKCEDYTQELCSDKPTYTRSRSYCEKVKTQLCYNKPTAKSSKTAVKVGYPVANKKCENNPVKLPKVTCRDVEEETCITLPYTKLEEVELEKCTAVLGPEKCEDAEIIVPKQICEELKEYYAPPPAHPAYHAPAPVHHAPVPAYHAPAPAYHAPAPPVYHTPAPAYHAPAVAGYHASLPVLSG